MYTDTFGIILRQFKIADGKRMIVMLTDKYGKISAGTSIPEKGKNKSSLSLRAFTKGRYELYKNKDTYNINGAEVIQSFYSIGEDIDKYLIANKILELTDKFLFENEPQAMIFNLLSDSLQLLAQRKSDFDTVYIAYRIKALVYLGLSLSENPLMKNESNDKINIISYIEKNPITVLEKLTLAEDKRKYFNSLLSKYILDNLGIDNLKSESFNI